MSFFRMFPFGIFFYFFDGKRFAFFFSGFEKSNYGPIDFIEFCPKNRKKGENLPPNIDLVEKIFYKTYIFKMPGQIKRYLKIFGESAVKILLLEDLIQDMEGTFKEILLFLEVDSNFKPDFELKNPYKTFRNKFIRNWIKKLSPKFGELRNKFTTKPLGVMKYIENLNTKYPQKEPLDPVIKLKLDKDFYPVIKELEIIINRNLSTWYKNN